MINDDDPSGLAEMWNLAAHTTLAADDTAVAVTRLDAATALLVHVVVDERANR